MPGQFISPEGDLETIFVDDYALIDQYVATGSLWTWGSNGDGQLGDNTSTSKSSPVQTISGGTNWKQVACGKTIGLNNFMAGIKTDGTLWTWGKAVFGNLGDNTSTSKSSPVQTISAGTNWNLVSAGYYYAAAIKTDGTLWTWGYNSNGQLGNNNITSYSSPIQTISAGTNWKQVSCGYQHIAAIKTDSTLWTWGSNGNGQLGDNTSTPKSSPVQTVSGGTNWKLVACGQYHTAAIKTDGTLWTWGANSVGQLGDNSTTNASSPVQTVSGGTNWKSLASAGNITPAIKTDGTLWLWGAGTFGELGNSANTNRSSPVQTVSGGTNWKSVNCGDNHVLAIKTDGTLWAWGLATTYGMLGANNTTNRNSPIQTVSGGTNWKSAAGGGYNSAAIHFYDANNQYPNA